MEMTFSYDCIAIKSEVVASTVYWPVELTEDQAERIKASEASGLYTTIDEDPNLVDVYEKVYNEALEIERSQEWADLVGKEYLPDNFRYPKEEKAEVTA